MERRDSLAILVTGFLVGATPAVWTSLLWDGVHISSAGRTFILAITLPPFAGIAALRAKREIGRAAAGLATVGVSALSVYGQALALNPHEESSTASLALFVGPIYGIAAVATIYGSEKAIRTLRRRVRR